jgi:hypothetical protein
VLAGKPLLQAVALDPWFGCRGMIHQPDTALAGSNPQSSLAIREQRIDLAPGNLVGDELAAGSAKANQAARVHAGPHVAGAVLRERVHTGRARRSREQLPGSKRSPSAGGAAPMAHAIVGAGPNVVARVPENSQNRGTRQPVANGIDPLG